VTEDCLLCRGGPCPAQCMLDRRRIKELTAWNMEQNEQIAELLAFKKCYEKYFGTVDVKEVSEEINGCWAENQRYRDALEEVREVWAGSDGFVPETCPEGYLQRLLKKCYQASVNAIKEREG